MAASADEIRAVIAANRDTNPAFIVSEANRTNTSLADIAEAGFSEREISIWLGDHGFNSSMFTGGVSGAAPAPAPPAPAPTPAPTPAPGAAPAPTPAPPAPAPAPGTGGVTSGAAVYTLSTLWANHRGLMLAAAAVVVLLVVGGAAKKGK